MVLDASNTIYIDQDMLNLLRVFESYGSMEKNIYVELVGFTREYQVVNSVSHVTSAVSDNGDLISPNHTSNGAKVPSNVLLVK